MKPDEAINRVKRELHRALDHTRADLDRIEMLTAALIAFSKPVPGYEPQFQHMHGLGLTRHEIN
jgi:chromosome segregation and condensation protein ScpB